MLFLGAFYWLSWWYAPRPTTQPRPQPPTKSGTSQSRGVLPTMPGRRDSWDGQPSLSRLFLGEDTMVRRTVKSLSVQIGVLYFRWSITATAIGDRTTNVSLTFRIPRGGWLQINRYRAAKLQSQLRAENRPVIVHPPSAWEKNRPWYRSLIQG